MHSFNIGLISRFACQPSASLPAPYQLDSCRFDATTGVAHFVLAGDSFWLLDEFASIQHLQSCSEELLHIILRVEDDGSAVLGVYDAFGLESGTRRSLRHFYDVPTPTGLHHFIVQDGKLSLACERYDLRHAVPQ